MIQFSLKFPDKAMAIPLLFTVDYEGNVSPIYQMYNGNGEGILTERYTNNEGDEGLRLPSDGSYHVDILANELPSDLEKYQINPSEEFRKHRFFGEN